ncbi:hypothetical protein OQI_30825 [Streptomyces pharetrae CZA14]|uniref:Secreted protein n=1 Tax=Streptomyces pharetrae CZA14 TaxID=1144883 RepID=A0ABX3YAU0_9ACTN|nr:hypothetical protein OQI_30825 [Streptomyces pharetrae CZA14]
MSVRVPLRGHLVTFVLELLAVIAQRFGGRSMGRTLGAHAHSVGHPVDPKQPVTVSAGSSALKWTASACWSRGASAWRPL